MGNLLLVFLVGPIVGIFSIFNFFHFSIIFLTFHIFALLYSKKYSLQIQNFTNWIIIFSSNIFWLTFFPSRKEIPEFNAVAEYGFPYTAFRIVENSGGHVNVWPGIYFDYFLCILLAFLITYGISKAKFFSNKKFIKILLGVSLYISLYFFGYLFMF